ncbi:MAG: molybdopterin cofactor-binding domain-containing protein [Pseudomonadota bacterium]
MKRRVLLISAVGAAGALLVGWLPPRGRLGSVDLLSTAPGENIPLNGWIRIAPDGQVQLAMPRSEMGQGVHTALAMLVAEELDVSLESVRLIEAGHDTIYGNVAMFSAALPFRPEDSQPGSETPRVRLGRWTMAKLARELGINATGGSSTIADLWQPLRLAAATARGQLLGAASLQWKLPVADLTISNGVIGHATGLSGHFGEFAEFAARTPPGDAAPKLRSAWTLIGTPAPRTDIVAKACGAARFGIDVRLPGMVYAAVRHAPALGGSPGAVDDRATLQLPGVERVVRLPSYAGSTPALAVIGRSSWHAQRGADALQVDWRARPAGPLDSAAIQRALEEAARGGAGFVFHERGDATATLQAAAQQGQRVLEGVYRAPYLAHAAMEPINCTALVKDGAVEVWVPTQVPRMARALAAQVAGVPVEAVTVHVTLLGGGFGRRLDIDFVGQAVRVAMETQGRPVQLLWSREEDITHDFYRPAGVAVLRAALDRQGRPLALAISSAGDAPAPRWLERTLAPQSAAIAGAVSALGDLDLPRSLQPALDAVAGPLLTPDKSASEGLYDLPYAIAHLRIAHVATHSGVPVGFWRSVGHSHNAFFGESFIDELAHAAGDDPVAFRLSMLEGLPRHAAVLKLAAEKAGWDHPPPPGRARGVALHESFDSIVAEVVELSLQGRTPRVHRVVCAIDCGTVVNPGIVAQQMESGVIFGLSAALYGRIDIENGIVRQRNFPDHPILTLAQAPLVETHIVASERNPGGVGEVAVPPIAPAVASALFALTGKRLRELPLTL